MQSYYFLTKKKTKYKQKLGTLKINPNKTKYLFIFYQPKKDYSMWQ